MKILDLLSYYYFLMFEIVTILQGTQQNDELRRKRHEASRPNHILLFTIINPVYPITVVSERIHFLNCIPNADTRFKEKSIFFCLCKIATIYEKFKLNKSPPSVYYTYTYLSAYVLDLSVLEFALLHTDAQASVTHSPVLLSLAYNFSIDQSNKFKCFRAAEGIQ